MKFTNYLLTSLCFILTAACSQNNVISLFSGHDLNDWDIVGDANWRFENDELISDSGGLGYVVTQKNYRNFKLSLEFFPVAEVNSGIFIRIADRNNISATSAYEMNIWDEHPNQAFRTGVIVTRVAPPLAHVETLDQWNTYEIIINNDHMTAKVNDILTAELTDNSLPEGPIALQRGDTGTIRFRHIKLTPLP